VSYTFYSVRKYFGFLRACGADHFDTNYKNMPFEKRGIFKWIPNAMYTIAMLVWLCFAIISGSKAMFVFAVL
jgi:protein-S-isoprenylcysteine O-methyltransferase Ste14